MLLTGILKDLSHHHLSICSAHSYHGNLSHEKFRFFFLILDFYYFNIAIEFTNNAARHLLFINTLFQAPNNTENAIKI